jgi:hypothetical protein
MRPFISNVTKRAAIVPAWRAVIATSTVEPWVRKEPVEKS